MTPILNTTLSSRKFLLTLVADISHQNLFKVPSGFSNNIWWNLAHLVVTQQLLCYKLAGETMTIPTDLVNAFKKGSVPTDSVSEAAVAEIKDLLLLTIESTQKDLDAGLFKNYNSYTTSAGVTLSSIEDAMAFNLYHEGLHAGAIIGLKKALGI